MRPPPRAGTVTFDGLAGDKPTRAHSAVARIGRVVPCEPVYDPGRDLAERELFGCAV